MPSEGSGRAERVRGVSEASAPGGLPVVGLGCAGTGLGCFLLVALLGPSVMQPALPGHPGEPPYSLVVHPSAALVIGLTAFGVLLSAAGLWLCCRAVRRGWSSGARTLLVAGGIAAVAFMIMPPVGSADHLNYAAYGRMAVTGNDPYTTAARDLPIDPVVGAVQDWRDVPTVYGPLATAQETFASLIGGTSVRATVFVLSVTNVVAFLAVGLLLWRAARGDPGRELRAALLWAANPLLLFELVGGAHNDVLAIALALAGLVVFSLPDTAGQRSGRWGRCLGAGLLIGAGALVKVNVAIVIGGPALVLLGRCRRERTRVAPYARLAALAGAAAAVWGTAYLMAGPHSFDQLSRASKAVSLATPWHLFAGASGGLVLTLPRSAIQAGSALLAAVLAVLLYRAVPGRDADASGQHSARSFVDQGGDAAPRVAAVLALAWLFAAPYALPWYDGLGWATVGLLAVAPGLGSAGPGLERLLIVRTSLLALAYLPARDPRFAGLPQRLDWLITVVRARITPWTMTVILLALIALASLAFRAPAPVRSRRARAGSPPPSPSPGSPRRSR